MVAISWRLAGGQFAVSGQLVGDYRAMCRTFLAFCTRSTSVYAHNW
ncbi:hypothetical protein HMPREF3190_00942 [Umbribacter vaginalis]|nr:hypothetical protein HMPREF3190_00942 [Coriobacteriales bacterium DNF00809]